ncbi:hypothetical protein D9M70_628680 [compost metagenome]
MYAHGALQQFMALVDRIDQVLLVHRLREKIDRAITEGTTAGLDITMTGDNDRRPVYPMLP